MGLKIEYYNLREPNQPYGYIRHGYVVYAQDLERALEKATVVYEINKPDLYWSNSKESCDTHKALLIGVEELPKEPLKHEIESFYYDDMYSFSVAVPKSFEGKKFRTIFEEIKE